MATPFIQFLPPTPLDGYRADAPLTEQPPHIPAVFLDAMAVRQAVFVKEQEVPAELEFDQDDARSCHWVIYASIHDPEPHSQPTIPTAAAVPQTTADPTPAPPMSSATRTVPVGTLRAVPFPQYAHPADGARYEESAADADTAIPGAAAEVSEVPPRLSLFAQDRATELHDGKELYVKLGRLAVLPEYRGKKLAALLVRTALHWLRDNPTHFNSSVAELQLDQLGEATGDGEGETTAVGASVGKVGALGDIPQWMGLVGVHAQEAVVPAWESFGFTVDQGLGRWWEARIPHRGMFQRMEIDSQKQLQI